MCDVHCVILCVCVYVWWKLKYMTFYCISIECKWMFLFAANLVRNWINTLGKFISCHLEERFFNRMFSITTKIVANLIGSSIWSPWYENKKTNYIDQIEGTIKLRVFLDFQTIFMEVCSMLVWLCVCVRVCGNDETETIVISYVYLDSIFMCQMRKFKIKWLSHQKFLSQIHEVHRKHNNEYETLNGTQFLP